MVSRFLLLGMAWLLPGLAGAQEAPSIGDPWTACRRAIAAAEPRSGLPAGLLMAIAMVESGRAMPRGGVAPWPFALNYGGAGHFPETREAAIAEVEAWRAQGQQSVDVGCMQINLFYHPTAFPTLPAAFDPPTNVAYAVRFLRDLRARTGNWPDAVAQYHSNQPARGAAYNSRVLIARLNALLATTLPRQMAGLCAPGMRPVMSPGPAGRPRVTCRSR